MRALILRVRRNFDLTPLLSVTLVGCTARHRRLLEPGEVTELPRIAAARSYPARIGPDPGPLLAESRHSQNHPGGWHAYLDQTSTRCRWVPCTPKITPGACS